MNPTIWIELIFSSQKVSNKRREQLPAVDFIRQLKGLQQWVSQAWKCAQIRALKNCVPKVCGDAYLWRQQAAHLILSHKPRARYIGRTIGSARPAQSQAVMSFVSLLKNIHEVVLNGIVSLVEWISVINPLTPRVQKIKIRKLAATDFYWLNLSRK